jgi:hypothetical protein
MGATKGKNISIKSKVISVSGIIFEFEIQTVFRYRNILNSLKINLVTPSPGGVN